MKLWLGLVLLTTGCLDARLDELDVRSKQVKGDIQRLNRQLELLDAGVTRAERILQESGLAENFPSPYDPERLLPEGHPTKPDVILLSIDTLRADHLGAWGYERDTSPFLDELAREGTLFRNAWSVSPWTLPSHTTMLSGQFPNRHGAVEDHIRIRPDLPLLQERFQAADYATAGVVATMFVSSKYGFDRGFDYFQDFGVKDKKTNNLSTVDAEHVFAHALNWAQGQDDGTPLFAFVHVYDAHYGYNAPPPFDERFDRAPRIGDAVYRSYFDYKKQMISDEQLTHQVAQYDEEIAYIDHMFRDLVTRWRRSGRELIVMVTADHGEEFGERGSWGHAHTLFREQLHVPWIVHGPGIRAQDLDQRVGLEDLAPTLASLTGLAPLDVDGVDRAPTLTRGTQVYARRAPGRYAETSRFETLSYRWHEPPYDLLVDMKHGTRILCHLRQDPGCTNNLYKNLQSRGVTMFKALTDHMGQPWKAAQDVDITLSPGTFLYKGTQRFKEAASLTSGQRFAVHPVDGRLRLDEEAGEGGSSEPPVYRALGQDCLHPDGRVLAYEGDFLCHDSEVVLDASDRALLEQLGYLQDEP